MAKDHLALLCRLANNDKVPKLPWASIIPAHFLPIWKNFLATLHATNSAPKKRDELIEQLIPIFHNPNIALPMRILHVQEVRKLAGLESILTVDRHGTKILTEKVIRDFCGNSFHPDLIDAALGSDEQFQGWVCGTNDAQPCHTAAPQQQDVYGKYQQLLRQVLQQGSVRGVQLKADRVDFAAKWRHQTLGEPEQSTVIPDIRQPTVFSFLHTAKATTKTDKQEADKIPFGDQELASALGSVKMDWLLSTAVTYENVPLSARMLMLAVSNGVGLQIPQQEVREKYVALFQEYLKEDKLCAIHQLATVLQIATLGSTHRFPFGFIVWAPKFTQPPLFYVGAHKPCLLFLLVARGTDQPFLFGTAAYDYLQQTDFFINSQITQIKADVVQLTHCVFTTTPIVVRIDKGKHYLHLSEFAAINTPFCAMCFLSVLGAQPCFVHATADTAKVTHLVGGLEGTGGLSIVGEVAEGTNTVYPDWVVVHIVNNQQVHTCLEANEMLLGRASTPLVWSPMWYSHHIDTHPATRRISKKMLHHRTFDETGEYLVYPSTEEWSRLLISPWRSSLLSKWNRNDMMLLRTLPAPFLRTLKKTLSRCVKVAFSQEHGTPSPPYLHQIRDLSILPKMLKVAIPWWNLTLEQIAVLFWQNSDDFYQVLSADTRNIDASAMQEVGRIILQYRHSIRQDLPFRLKRLHNWNVSGWTPSQAANDPKMRLIKRLLHTGPVSLQETRWHAETPQNLYHNIPGLRIAHSAGLPTERGGTSGGVAILIPPGWMLDRTEEIIPGRAVLAVLQDRYSTLGLISVYLHPQSKGDELRQLLAWAKGTKVDFPLYINGDFNQVDKTVPEVWTDFLVQAQVTDVQPELKTFEGPSGLSALDRVLCPTDYIAAAQIDVLVAAHRRHHLSGHYQLTTKFVIRPSVQSDIRDPIHQTIPSDVFCPGRTEADPYTIPNDLQELIRRLQRLQGADELEFVATLWSWWRQQPIPSSHPRIPAYELLRKYLKIRAEVLHIPAEQYRALQSVTYHLFAAPSAEAVQRDKVSIRSDVLRQMFDFHDQISASKGYANLEQINVQARGIGSNINFWNRLRSICPKGATYNGPILNQNDEHCTTSKNAG